MKLDRFKKGAVRLVRRALALGGVRSVSMTFGDHPIRMPIGAVSLKRVLGKRALHHHEAEFFEMVRGVIEPGWVVFDIGAFIGLITFGLSNEVGPDGEVHAFEPNPENFANLEALIRLNGLENATAHPLAVAGEPGRLQMRMSDITSTLNTGLDTDPAHRYAEVEVVTVDSVVARLQRSPHALKIDTEGFEMAVLAGAEETLAQVEQLFVEVHPKKMKKASGHTEEDFFAFLGARGFDEVARFLPPKHRQDMGKPYNVILQRRVQ